MRWWQRKFIKKIEYSEDLNYTEDIETEWAGEIAAINNLLNIISLKFYAQPLITPIHSLIDILDQHLVLESPLN